MATLCPTCTQPLGFVEEGRLQCAQGHGDLIDRATVDRCLQATEGISEDQLVSLPGTEGIGCPACQTRMVARRLPGLDLDHCANCHAAWLDPGELGRAISRSQPKPPPHALSNAQPRSGPPSTATQGAAPLVPPYTQQLHKLIGAIEGLRPGWGRVLVAWVVRAFVVGIILITLGITGSLFRKAYGALGIQRRFRSTGESYYSYLREQRASAWYRDRLDDLIFGTGTTIEVGETEDPDDRIHMVRAELLRRWDEGNQSGLTVPRDTEERIKRALAPSLPERLDELRKSWNFSAHFLICTPLLLVMLGLSVASCDSYLSKRSAAKQRANTLERMRNAR